MLAQTIFRFVGRSLALPLAHIHTTLVVDPDLPNRYIYYLRMKFVAALVAALLVADVAGVKLNKALLLRNAVPVDKHGNRRLADDNAAFEISAAYSIQFNQCISLSTEPANSDVMFGEDTLEYTQKGEIISQTSYVVFNVCKTQYCSYAAEDNMYMVDLAGYMDAMLKFVPNENEQYCKACEEAYEWCTYV